MPFFATLTVDDPAAVAAWYERALGFGAMFAGPVVHIRRRKYQDLLLAAGPQAAPPGGLTLTFQADGEVGELAARARAAEPLGASQVEDVVRTPWNTRDLRVTDPAGNRLVFTERDAEADPADPETVRRWQEMFEADRQR